MAKRKSSHDRAGSRKSGSSNHLSDAKKHVSESQLAIAKEFENRLGYVFKDKSLMFEALTHASSVEKRLNSYERMEFLGDSILGFVVCEYLYSNFPQWDEGDLTKVKSNIVSRSCCATMGAELGLSDFLAVGKGIGAMKKVPGSLLANAFEALIAAIYLDGGVSPVRQFLLPLIEKQVAASADEDWIGNYKSELQHYVQKRFGIPPEYLELGSFGPDHQKQFRIAARVVKRVFQPAWGKNKKEAEQKAAANALAEIAGQPPPHPDHQPSSVELI